MNASDPAPLETPLKPAACPPEGWTYATVSNYIDKLLDDHPGAAQRSTIGWSYEGLPIELLRIGDGKRRVLAWAQMHGDEHTYTTVVLNTLRKLIQTPQDPDSASILAGCTLMLIPLLNPDGAARRTRVNAQGVDINRDAREPDTPEGRVLRQAVLELRPDFGFNLHNQNHRRWLRTGEGPVSVSLLAPPRDEANSQTPSVLAARRIAACITKHVRPLCGGRVTRYSASYMPRAFGEWVQSQGVATVLLEAGGWPGGDIGALEQVNFEAFLAGLRSISADAYQTTEPDDYDNLARASGPESFDLLIRRARVVQQTGATGSRLDLGVNSPNNSAIPDRLGEGRIDDIGDLSFHPRDAWIDAEGLLCLPGRVALGEWRTAAGGGLDQSILEHAARVGVTTMLLTIDHGVEQFEQIRRLESGPRPLVNVGVLLRSSDGSRCGDWHALPPVVLGVAPQSPALAEAAPCAVKDWRAGLEMLSRCFDVDSFEIRRGAAADLVLAQPPAESRPIDAIDRVLLGGTTVLQGGQIVERHAGRWLMRSRTLNHG